MNGSELHFHALPGVDDGPETVDASLELLLAATVEGTGTVVATPHVRTDFLTDVSELTERVKELQVRGRRGRSARVPAPGRRARHDIGEQCAFVVTGLFREFEDASHPELAPGLPGPEPAG